MKDNNSDKVIVLNEDDAFRLEVNLDSLLEHETDDDNKDFLQRIISKIRHA